MPCKLTAEAALGLARLLARLAGAALPAGLLTAVFLLLLVVDVVTEVRLVGVDEDAGRLAGSAGALLTGAFFAADACLAGACLTGGFFATGAFFAGAFLTGDFFATGAFLAGAFLAGAFLTGGFFATGAFLAGAFFAAGAFLAGAFFATGAFLAGALFAGAFFATEAFTAVFFTAGAFLSTAFFAAADFTVLLVAVPLLATAVLLLVVFLVAMVKSFFDYSAQGLLRPRVIVVAPSFFKQFVA